MAVREHHDSSRATKRKFQQDVKLLASAIEDLGNPFADDSLDVHALDTKLVTSKEAIRDFNQLLTTRNEQVQQFYKQRLLNREVPITDAIPKNGYLFFTQKKARTSSKVEEKLKMAKSDVALFSRLFISFQARQGDLEQLRMKTNLTLHLYQRKAILGQRRANQMSLTAFYSHYTVKLVNVLPLR